MTDLEGNELEVGTIYILPGGNNFIVISRYSHETSGSYIFKPVKGVNAVVHNVYTWKRQLSKFQTQAHLPIVRASDTLLNKHNLC